MPSYRNTDWDNEGLNLIDWRIDPEAKTVKLTYQSRNEAYAPIHDSVFRVMTERSKLQRPNRSRNWELAEYGDYWRNRKTGEKVYI